MIKVNLYQRKAAVGVSTGDAPAGGAGDIGATLRGLVDKLRGGAGASEIDLGDQKSALILAVVYAVVLGGGWWYADDQKLAMIAEVDAEAATLDSKINLLSSELGKTSGYELIKKSLEADEKTIRTKINTIQELIRERSVPPKILTTLSESIPKEVWLREFSLKDRHFKLAGGASSMDVVSDFMKGLEETIYFRGVVLKSSKQITEKGGRSSATFELEAERR
jgi:Tfp pilus assembly protein PilN